MVAFHCVAKIVVHWQLTKMFLHKKVIKSPQNLPYQFARKMMVLEKNSNTPACINCSYEAVLKGTVLSFCTDSTICPYAYSVCTCWHNGSMQAGK